MSEHLDYFEVFPWNKNLETGHPEIDAQHKKLVGLLNKLANSIAVDEQQQVNETFDELAAYANYHFEAEEAIWAEQLKDDNWFVSHQLSHASFLPKVVELRDQEGNKPLSDIIEDILKFLIRWLAFHIIDDDKRLAIMVEELKKGVEFDQAKINADRAMTGSIRVLIETVMQMYDGLSSRTLELMRERHARKKAEAELRRANKELEFLSVTDQLTKLGNRRDFERVSEREIKRCKREQFSFSFMIFDIDYFKKYNDEYGHQAGDTALQKVASAIQTACRRPTDYPFRLGGEEFAIISVDHDNQHVGQFAEIVRKAVEDMEIEHKASFVAEHVTISVGAVSIVPEEHSIDDFIKIADERLYKAKKTGRNKVIAEG